MNIQKVAIGGAAFCLGTGIWAYSKRDINISKKATVQSRIVSYYGNISFLSNIQKPGTDGTKAIQIANSSIFGQWFLSNGNERLHNTLEKHFMTSQEAIERRRYYTMITSCFSHITLPHFLFNNLALLSIGPTFEHIWSSEKFLTYFIVSCISSSLFSHTLSKISFKYINKIPFATPAARYSLAANCLGASGAIASLFTCYAFMFPHSQFGIQLLPFHFDALKLIQGFITFDLIGFFLLLRRGFGISNLGHQAHLGGYLTGYLLYKYANPWENGLRTSSNAKKSWLSF